MSSGMPAGSGRSVRLDPFALPVRYKAGDPGADERERTVEIHRERVIVRRRVHGIPMKLSMQVREYLGVAIRIVPPCDDFDGAIAVMLEHRDKGLSVPLFVASNGRAIRLVRLAGSMPARRSRIGLAAPPCAPAVVAAACGASPALLRSASSRFTKANAN